MDIPALFNKLITGTDISLGVTIFIIGVVGLVVAACFKETKNEKAAPFIAASTIVLVGLLAWAIAAFGLFVPLSQHWTWLGVSIVMLLAGGLWLLRTIKAYSKAENERHPMATQLKKLSQARQS